MNNLSGNLLWEMDDAYQKHLTKSKLAQTQVSKDDNKGPYISRILYSTKLESSKCRIFRGTTLNFI